MGIKANSTLITNPMEFRRVFLAQTVTSDIDDEYESVLRIFLYYIWQGINETKIAMLQDRLRMDLGNLCVASFISLLPVIQCLRLGFPSDAMILLRALMERIALLGYLQKKPDLIEKYCNGDHKIQSDAMAWAKNNSLENWMRLYSALSNIAHPKIEGVAGYILSENPFSSSFRLNMPPTETDSDGIDAEVLAAVLYGVMAIDSIMADIIGNEHTPFLQPDRDLLQYISKNDLLEFKTFAEKLIEKHTKPK